MPVNGAQQNRSGEFVSPILSLLVVKPVAVSLDFDRHGIDWKVEKMESGETVVALSDIAAQCHAEMLERARCPEQVGLLDVRQTIWWQMILNNSANLIKRPGDDSRLLLVQKD